MEQQIKVMTFNIRVNADKGANDFELRKARIVELIESEQPELIGFQEATDHMRAELRTALSPDYIILGCGREASYHGESTCVAVKADALEIIEMQNFWLSNAPTVAGSRYGSDQSGCPRITTALRLKKNGSEPFWFINTHLDHEGVTARLLGATQLLQYISSLSEKCILTGDFNAEPDEKCIRLLTGELKDATADIVGSFHAFRDLEDTELSKIDYIFTNFDEFEQEILYPDKPKNGTFMSDHRPLSVEITLK